MTQNTIPRCYAIVNRLGNGGCTATSWQFSHSTPGAPLVLQLSTQALTMSMGGLISADVDAEGAGTPVVHHLSTVSRDVGMLASPLSDSCEEGGEMVGG